MEIIDFYTSAPLFLQIAMPIQAGIFIWMVWVIAKAHREENKRKNKK